MNKTLISDKKTLEDINDQFQEFQDDLTSREKKLKLPSSWDTSSMDDLISLLDIPKKTPPSKKVIFR